MCCLLPAAALAAAAVQPPLMWRSQLCLSGLCSGSPIPHVCKWLARPLPSPLPASTLSRLQIATARRAPPHTACRGAANCGRRWAKRALSRPTPSAAGLLSRASPSLPSPDRSCCRLEVRQLATKGSSPSIPFYCRPSPVPFLPLSTPAADKGHAAQLVSLLQGCAATPPLAHLRRTTVCGAATAARATILAGGQNSGVHHFPT
jgi:hypothetical protein